VFRSRNRNPTLPANATEVTCSTEPTATLAPVHLEALPGGDLIERGLRDLEQGRETIHSLLVSIGAPRLRHLVELPASSFAQPEHRLYELLAREDPDSAHSRYNAFVRRLVSFERAAECAIR